MNVSGPPAVHDPARTVEALFPQSWAVFRRNWMVALPPLIAGVLTLALIAPLIAAFAYSVLRAFKEPPAAVMLDSGIAAAAVVAGTLSVVVGVWSNAASYGMADAAWSRGTTSLADGWTAFRRRGGAEATTDPHLHLPPLGPIVFAGVAYLATILLSLAYAGFIAIVLVGFYRRLVAEASET